MIELQPPNRIEGHYNSWPSLFLAGSIEMDTAERWQDKIIKDLADKDVVICNPRRDDWDNTIGQSAKDLRFREQVNWELDHIEGADIVAFYFDPNTKSPVTMLELGLVARYDWEIIDPQSIIVCCPPTFWRRGNVEMVCERANIMLVENYRDFQTTLAHWIDLAYIPPGQY
jgi:Nucleoside 2-deoxyribosyltransferase like